MKKQIKVMILILVVIIVYFMKIKNYTIEVNENDVQSIGYLVVEYSDYGSMTEIVHLSSEEVDDETQKIIVDMINNSKYKLKKITSANDTSYSPDKSRGEYYRVQSMIELDNYRVQILISTYNRKYSEVCVTNFDKMLTFEYKFEKESFEELSNFIKEYMDKIEQS